MRCSTLATLHTCISISTRVEVFVVVTPHQPPVLEATNSQRPHLGQSINISHLLGSKMRVRKFTKLTYTLHRSGTKNRRGSTWVTASFALRFLAKQIFVTCLNSLTSRLQLSRCVDLINWIRCHQTLPEITNQLLYDKAVNRNRKQRKGSKFLAATFHVYFHFYTNVFAQRLGK